MYEVIPVREYCHGSPKDSKYLTPEIDEDLATKLFEILISGKISHCL